MCIQSLHILLITGQECYVNSLVNYYVLSSLHSSLHAVIPAMSTLYTLVDEPILNKVMYN